MLRIWHPAYHVRDLSSAVRVLNRARARRAGDPAAVLDVETRCALFIQKGVRCEGLLLSARPEVSHVTARRKYLLAKHIREGMVGVEQYNSTVRRDVLTCSVFMLNSGELLCLPRRDPTLIFCSNLHRRPSATGQRAAVPLTRNMHSLCAFHVTRSGNPNLPNLLLAKGDGVPRPQKEAHRRQRLRLRKAVASEHLFIVLLSHVCHRTRLTATVRRKKAAEVRPVSAGAESITSANDGAQLVVALAGQVRGNARFAVNR